MSERPQDPEFSESGAPVYRHEQRRREGGPAASDDALVQAMGTHIASHVGSVSTVLHEVISDIVHIDVHVVSPTPERNYYTLVTTGMSALPMRPPDGLEEARYAEVMICLPADWPVSETTEFEEERRYWPIRWLKRLARFPHEFSTWLFWGHSIPNGDPPAAYAEDTELCCMVLLEPQLPDPGFGRLEVNGRGVHVFALVPIYPSEMELKLREGAESLQNRLREAGVTELLDPSRSPVG